MHICPFEHLLKTNLKDGVTARRGLEGRGSLCGEVANERFPLVMLIKKVALGIERLTRRKRIRKKGREASRNMERRHEPFASRWVNTWW